jgi:hypothetical protein
MVSSYQPGRGYEVLGRYLDGEWFRFTEEGLVLSCGFLIEVKLPQYDDDQSSASPREAYLFLKWGVRYLLQTFGKKYFHDHEEVDLWNIEIYDLEEMNFDGDDDASPAASAPAAVATAIRTHKFLPKSIKEDVTMRRQLKKKHHKERSSSSHSLLIVVETLVSDYEIGIAMKSVLDILFRVSIANDNFPSTHPSSSPLSSPSPPLLTILRFTYLQQLQYSTPGFESFFFELESEELKIQFADTLSGYQIDLVPLSSRPQGETGDDDRYYFQNITWETLAQLLNETASTSDTSETSSSSSDVWYEHLLILSSELDSGDILILLFLPIGILFGVIFLFQSYQSVHDQILGEMGYEIYHASHEYEDSESGINGQQQQQQQTSSSSERKESRSATGIEMR